MRACVQRVSQAKVLLQDDNNRVSGEIGKGFLVLLGVGQGDVEEDAKYLAKKISGLRIFEDEAGKMNLSLAQVDGRALVVSQFTLYGDCVKGNRPSFTDAAPPDTANRLYRLFVTELNRLGIDTEEGVFQANMGVALVNDGPVTILLDSVDRPRAKKN